VLFLVVFRWWKRDWKVRIEVVRQMLGGGRTRGVDVEGGSRWSWWGKACLRLWLMLMMRFQ
jgi:hypothetical protein